MKENISREYNCVSIMQDKQILFHMQVICTYVTIHSKEGPLISSSTGDCVPGSEVRWLVAMPVGQR